MPRSSSEVDRTRSVVLALAFGAATLSGCEVPRADLGSEPFVARAQQSPPSSPVAPMPEQLPYARGGTRLKARHYLAPNLEQFRFFYDEALRTECEWTRASTGGGMRCIPTRRVAPPYFLDERCTEAVILTTKYDLPEPASSPGDRNIRSGLVDGDFVSVDRVPDTRCGMRQFEPREVYRVGETISAPEGSRSALYRPGPGGCLAAKDEVLPFEVLQRAYAQPEDQFLDGSERSVEAGAGLTIERVRGSDGSEQTLAVRGPEGACALQPEGFCLSGRIAATPYLPFFDRACTRTATTEKEPESILCGPPKYLVERHSGAPTKVYALAPNQQVEKFTCAGADYPLSGETNGYTPGPDVAAATPRGRIVRFGDEELFLSQIVAASSDRAPLERGGYLEVAEGRPCSVYPAADGSSRCVPHDLAIAPTGYFADPECATFLYGTDAKRKIAELVIFNVESGPRWSLSRLETLSSVRVHDGPVYEKWQGNCTLAWNGGNAETTETSGSFGVPMLLPDQPLPFSRFTALQEADL